MKFVDSVRLKVKAGDGGNGAVAFRRESHMPFGGPSGGDGGRGGSVIFVADGGKTSLLDLAGTGILRAKRGENGRGSDQYGKGAEDFEVRVPVGTQVFDEESGVLVADMKEHGERAVVAKGGQGGRGNIHFSTPFDRAPRRAEPGTLGEERTLRLELKVLADVGLVGFPNVGKSTLVAAMSRARPKIADYPFTTLRPHLGVVKIGSRSSEAAFVLADIPGLIPGASEGHGLGTRFLKHVERCRALLHLVAPPTDETRGEGRTPLGDYDAIMTELRAFAPDLADRPMIVAMSKGDLPETQEAFPAVQKQFMKRGVRLRLISAAIGPTAGGLEALAHDLYALVRGHSPTLDDAEAEPLGELARMEPPMPAAAPAPQKPASKKPAAKKSSAKKPASTKPAAKKLTSKKPASKKPAAKKQAAKKPAAKKPAAKKSSAKSSVAKKPAAKKPLAKKPASKKPASKKPAAKKPLAKKPAAKKPLAKKPAAKKPLAKAAKKARGRGRSR
jgi:GTP-binding protein